MLRRFCSLILLVSLLLTLFSGCFRHTEVPISSSAAASRVTTALKTTASSSSHTSRTTRHTTSVSQQTSASATVSTTKGKSTATTAPTTTKKKTTTTTTTTSTATTTPPQETASWTVLEYLCGTDLESDYGAATKNLEEMLAANIDGADFHYVVETGGTKSWKCGVDAQRLQRWYLKDDQLVLVKELELASMGEAETLSDFLRWGVDTYPAEHYMLILWDHGGGCLSGVVFDELFENDSLTMQELNLALSDAGVHWDVLGFDACLMANLETAATVAPYADYMIASEESVPSSGWDYCAFTEHLAQNPYIEPEELATVICDTYMTKCAVKGNETMATLSVLDLNQLDKLILQFDSMAQEMDMLTTDITSFVSLAQSSKRAENYGGEHSNLVDLGDLILEAHDILPRTADETLKALSDTVIYHVYGENRAYSNGLSVFYPLHADSNTCTAYENLCVSEHYLHYISAVVSEWDTPSHIKDNGVKSVQASEFNVQMTTWLSVNSVYMLGITHGQESIEQVLFNIYYADDRTNSYILMGKDDDIIADWDTYIFQSNLSGIWMSLEGCYCAPQLLAREEEYCLYTIPILLNGVRSNLCVTYSMADKKYQILGVCTEADEETGIASRNIRMLQDGDEVSPLFDFVDMNTGESYTDYWNTITISGEPVLEEIGLFDGDYLYEFEVRDVFGNSYYSDPITITSKNGNQTLGFGR